MAVSLDLTGRTSLVPGSTQGIGAAIAATLASAGALVGRRIEPAEIANLVACPASPLASATTGAAVRVDGG